MFCNRWMESTTKSDVVKNVASWMPHLPGSPCPKLAVYTANTINGSAIYVGRSNHKGNPFPAFVIPSQKLAYIIWSDRKIPITDYKMLVGQGYDWYFSSGSKVPLHAVVVGKSWDGETLYVGRGFYNGRLLVGQVQVTRGGLVVIYDGREKCLNSYELLVFKENKKCV